jgi:hypothetical protein
MQGILLCNGRKISPLNICFVAWRPREYITYFMLLIKWKSTFSRCIYVTEACLWPKRTLLEYDLGHVQWGQRLEHWPLSASTSMSGGEGGNVWFVPWLILEAVRNGFWHGLLSCELLPVPAAFFNPWTQCWGSLTFWCGSGSADPHLWLMDPDPTPDPTPFFRDFKDAKKK